jgi:hypothetical protein
MRVTEVSRRPNQEEERNTNEMAPREQRASWWNGGVYTERHVTDDEGSVEETEEWVAHQRWRERLRTGFCYMLRMGPRGNVLPRVGDHCLVVTGKAGDDIGQMGRVTDVKTLMVEIGYRSPRNGKIVYKHKKPSSLVMLEDGLRLEQDKNGMVWIRRSKEEEHGKGEKSDRGS